MAQPECRVTEDDRSSTPRSRAAARIVSAAVVIRSPLIKFIGNGWVWRHTSSPGRRGRGSASSMAAKTGWAMVAGSHQPRSRAAVRWEKAAVLGRTSCHAVSSSKCVRFSAAAYTPRVMRSHSRPRSHPRAGAWCVLHSLIAPLAALAPRGSRREAAYFVVARRRNGVSARSSAARWRTIRCHAGNMRTWAAFVRASSASVDGPQYLLPPGETGHSQPQNGSDTGCE